MDPTVRFFEIRQELTIFGYDKKHMKKSLVFVGALAAEVAALAGVPAAAVSSREEAARLVGVARVLRLGGVARVVAARRGVA